MYVPNVAMSLKQTYQAQLLANVGKMKQIQAVCKTWFLIWKNLHFKHFLFIVM